jgi:hypothetical protein
MLSLRLLAADCPTKKRVATIVHALRWAACRRSKLFAFRKQRGTILQLPALRRTDFDDSGPVRAAPKLRGRLRSLLQANRNYLRDARRRSRQLRRQSHPINVFAECGNRKAGRRTRPACIQKIGCRGDRQPSESLSCVARLGPNGLHAPRKTHRANRGSVCGMRAANHAARRPNHECVSLPLRLLPRRHRPGFPMLYVLGVDQRQEILSVKRIPASGLLPRGAQGDIHAPIVGQHHHR